MRWGLGLTVLLTGLLGCSSAPKKTVSRPAALPVNAQAEEVDTSPMAFIDKAQQAYTNTGDLQLRNQWLLRAGAAYQSQQSCADTRKILRLLRPELVSNDQRTEANLLEAECQLQEQPNLDSLVTLRAGMSNQIGFDQRIAAVDGFIAEQEQRWLAAAESTLRSQLDAQLKPGKIWSLLQNMTESELQQARLRTTNLLPELQLALIVHQHGWSPATFAQQVQAWQRRYINHPLAAQLPADVSSAIETGVPAIEKIAVLIPTSGRLASQGNAIKEGLLAAYYRAVENTGDDNAMALQFFDSNRLSRTDLAATLAEFDAVIGPLVKDNIEKVLAVLPPDVPLLALNRVNQAPQAGSAPRAFFALAPEDEARQLATQVNRRGVTKPIVLAFESSVTQRMAEAFISRWQAFHPTEPEPAMALFTDNESMRKSVTTLLDVKQSKERVEQIEKLLGRQLYAVARNRRDIDGIVVFANPEQTELLNPIIESSLSPFNDKNVPVFASSRSHNQLRNKNSLRDLRNLTFTDMPWMLPEHRWQTLERQTETLWPQRNHTLRRLFALGFDSFELLPRLPMMVKLPQLRMQGLTGHLRLDEAGRVVRVLPMGHIDEQRVTLVAMD